MTNGSGQDSSSNGLGIEDDGSHGGFFSSLENDKPYLKIGFEGFAGSGKTYTAALVVIGLWQRLCKTLGRMPKIVLFDTETAGKFLIPLFRKAGIPADCILHKKSRALVDLQKTMELMRQGAADILMIDQVSHVWSSFVQGFLKERKKAKLSLPDWGYLKPLWNDKFATPLVMDPYHIALIGRAAFEYDTEISGEGADEARTMFKSGVKMQGAAELAFETDIFVLMEVKQDVLSKRGKKSVWREATILKDRSSLIDGQTFRNPTYENFAPTVEFCLGEAVRRPTQSQGDDTILHKNEDDQKAWFKRRDIAVEELEGVLLARWPSQGGADKIARQEAMFSVFGMRSWTAITTQKPEVIEHGKVKLEAYIADLQAKWEAEAAAAIEAKKAQEEAEAAELKAKEAAKEAERLAKEAAKAAKKSGKEAKGEPEPAAA